MQAYADSLFTPGPRRPINREQRRIWRARTELQRRAGRITALHVRVGDFLIKRVGQDGRCTPSKETLAADAGCSARTVGEALRRFRRLGMLEWVRRLVRHGQEVRQTSNGYRVLMGEIPTRQEKPKVSSSTANSAHATEALQMTQGEAADYERQRDLLRDWLISASRPTACHT